MTPLRALHLALAICHSAQARLSRSRSRVHHSTIHHATTHRRRLYLTGTDVHYDGAEASKYDGVWASDRASLTPWESFVRAAFGYSLLHRGNASADVRTGRFLATYLEPVVGGLEWVPLA